MATRQHRTEERIAHLERTAEELSDEVTRQSRQLAMIERQLAMLVEREAQREAEAGIPIPLTDQKPPHW